MLLYTDRVVHVVVVPVVLGHVHLLHQPGQHNDNDQSSGRDWTRADNPGTENEIRFKRVHSTLHQLSGLRYYRNIRCDKWTIANDNTDLTDTNLRVRIETLE